MEMILLNNVRLRLDSITTYKPCCEKDLHIFTQGGYGPHQFSFEDKIARDYVVSKLDRMLKVKDLLLHLHPIKTE
jgi:hypothetical protein